MQLFEHPVNWGSGRTVNEVQRTSPFFYKEQTTFANKIDVTGDGTGAVRKFTHIFVKCSGVASYSAAVTDSSDSAYTSFASTMPSTVTDSSGDSNSTVIDGIQYDLLDVRNGTTPRDAKQIDFTFTAKTSQTVRVYELMVLNLLESFEDVETEWQGQPEMLGGIRSSILGTLHKVPVLGGKEKRESFSLTVRSLRTDTLTRDLKQLFTKHRHFVCAVEYKRYPDLVFPALVQPSLELQYLNDWKGAGKRLSFQITER